MSISSEREMQAQENKQNTLKRRGPSIFKEIHGLERARRGVGDEVREVMGVEGDYLHKVLRDTIRAFPSELES